MGCAELIARVVSGMANAPELFATAVAAEAAVVAAAAPCGLAAFAACSFTSKETTTTETTGKKRISQRIFIQTSVIAKEWNHTAGN
jgi:hypothetical protein